MGFPLPRSVVSRDPLGPVQVCVLGGFAIHKQGAPIEVRAGGRTEQLVGALALRAHDGIGRDELITTVWPASEERLAVQALSTLMHDMSRRLADALAGEPPVIRRNGRYRLNTDAGVIVDMVAFDAAAETGERMGREGDRLGAMTAYEQAASIYRGDLFLATEVAHVLERERLRARYLSIRARLADFHFAAGDYGSALEHALALLAGDPCREDAHRMAMRCYVRRGERAQAMRQYRVCREVLALEFQVEPEPATQTLFDLVRTQPAEV